MRTVYGKSYRDQNEENWITRHLRRNLLALKYDQNQKLYFQTNLLSG